MINLPKLAGKTTAFPRVVVIPSATATRIAPANPYRWAIRFKSLIAAVQVAYFPLDATNQAQGFTTSVTNWGELFKYPDILGAVQFDWWAWNSAGMAQNVLVLEYLWR